MESLRTVPGNLLTLKTNLYRSIQIDHLTVCNEKTGQFKSISASEANWNFPYGKFVCKNGQVLYFNGLKSSFNLCQLDPSTLEINKLSEKKSQDNHNRIWGLRSNLFR